MNFWYLEHVSLVIIYDLPNNYELYNNHILIALASAGASFVLCTTSHWVMGMIFYTPKIAWFSRILELEFKNLSKIYLEYFQFYKNILLIFYYLIAYPNNTSLFCTCLIKYANSSKSPSIPTLWKFKELAHYHHGYVTWQGF
jgi:hypothetical protein